MLFSILFKLALFTSIIVVGVVLNKLGDWLIGHRKKGGKRVIMFVLGMSSLLGAMYVVNYAQAETMLWLFGIGLALFGFGLWMLGACVFYSNKQVDKMIDEISSGF